MTQHSQKSIHKTVGLYISIDFFFFLIFIPLFLSVLGSHCCSSFSLVETSQGYSLVVMQGLLTLVASLVAEHRL